MAENERALARCPPVEVVQTEIVDRDKVRLGRDMGADNTAGAPPLRFCTLPVVLSYAPFFSSIAFTILAGDMGSSVIRTPVAR